MNGRCSLKKDVCQFATNTSNGNFCGISTGENVIEKLKKCPLLESQVTKLKRKYKGDMNIVERQIKVMFPKHLIKGIF